MGIASRSLLIPAFLAVMSTVVAAGGSLQSTRIGAMTVEADASIWRIERRADGDVIFHPLGDFSLRHDPVRIVRRAGGKLEDCQSLASATWGGEAYAEPRGRALRIAGKPAIEVVVATGCRNATPSGTLTCMADGRDLYTLALVNRVDNCRSYDGVLFADPSLREALLAGIRFDR